MKGWFSDLEILEIHQKTKLAKLVGEKIGIPSKSMKKLSKPGLEFRLKTRFKNQGKQAKMIKQRKDAGICRNRKEKATRE